MTTESRESEHRMKKTMIDFIPFFHVHDPHMPSSIILSLQGVLTSMKPLLATYEGMESLVVRGSVVKNMHRRSPYGLALDMNMQEMTGRLAQAEDYASLPPYTQKAIQKLQGPPDIDISFGLQNPDDFRRIKYLLGFHVQNGMYRKTSLHGAYMTWEERRLQSEYGDPVHQSYLGITDKKTGVHQLFDFGTIPQGLNFEKEDHRLGLCSSYWDMLSAQDIRFTDRGCVVEYSDLSYVLNYPDHILHEPEKYTDILRLFGRISLNNYLWLEGRQDEHSMGIFTHLFHTMGKDVEKLPHYEVVKLFTKLAMLRPGQFAHELFATGLIHHMNESWEGLSEKQMAEELMKLSFPETSPQELVRIIRLLDPYLR